LTEPWGQEAPSDAYIKLAFIIVGFAAMLRIGPAYYYHLEFDDFVKHQAQRARTQGELKQALFNEAAMDLIPLEDADIKITRTGRAFRVDVDYTSPVDLFVYNRAMTFHTVGAGFLHE
jgi:hypothetical protein